MPRSTTEARRYTVAARGVAATALLVVAVPLCLGGREPFVTWYYPICWFAIVLLLDAARILSGAGRLVAGGAVVPLLFWSAALWYLFEAANLRVSNWYYVFVPDTLVVQATSSVLSFATVLPALFLLELLLARAGLFRNARCRPFRPGVAGRRAFVAAGVVSLLLVAVRPGLFFPLLWVAPLLVVAPWNAIRLENPLLGELAQGRPGRLGRILVAGLICGVIWESLNFCARTRWIYTVPFFEELKIFEMPLLGFLGFPPFAVECVVLYGTLVGSGLAPPVGPIRQRPGLRRASRPARVAAWVVASAGMAAVVHFGLDRSVGSYTPRLGPLALPEPVVRATAGAGIDDAFALGRMMEKPLFRDLLAREGVDTERVKERVALALHRGIGSVHARALKECGVERIGDLAGRDAALLSRRLNEIVARGPPPAGRAGRVTPARVRVWIAGL